MRTCTLNSAAYQVIVDMLTMLMLSGSDLVRGWHAYILVMYTEHSLVERYVYIMAPQRGHLLLLLDQELVL